MLFQKLASTIDAPQLRFVVPYSAGLSVLCRPLIPHMLLVSVHHAVVDAFNPLNAELNPICCLLALLGAHYFLHVSRIRVKSLTLSILMSYIYI